jgi:hypothetical protein
MRAMKTVKSKRPMEFMSTRRRSLWRGDERLGQTQRQGSERFVLGRERPWADLPKRFKIQALA